MEKYNWRDDPELRIMLADTTPAPKAVTGPKFYSQYRFVIMKKHDTIVKNFVPEWAVDIVKKMLDADPNVRSYFYQRIYKGNISGATPQDA